MEIQKTPIYYQALGKVKRETTPEDLYRFHFIKRYLQGNSVLDVGCCTADFLLLIKDKYRIGGTEVNTERVNYCNSLFGQDVVKLGNLDEPLHFDDNSFDTVTCMEVIEHLENPKAAIQELYRISKNRLIITVPYNEIIQYILCLNCAKYTPYSGHLHSFNEQNIFDYLPENSCIKRIELINNNILRRFHIIRRLSKLPFNITVNIDKLLNILRHKAIWMLVIIDKC